jgi:predicted phosphodiesterase
LTRLAFLSDIHANLPALEAIIADIARFPIDHVIVAGDLINCGPFSTQVLERVLSLHWAVIRGNHEFYLLDYGTPREPEQWQGFMLPPWLNATIPSYWRHIISALPDSLTLYYQDAPPICVAHGVPGNPWASIYAETPDDEVGGYLEHTPESTVVVGHTHLPMERYLTANDHTWHILNPGTAGIPLNGLPGTAQYMLLDGSADGWKATFRRISYDITPLLNEFERIGFVEACGATGKMLIEEFRTAHLYILPFQTWRRKTYPNEPESLLMADEFLRLEDDIWQYIPPHYQINRQQFPNAYRLNVG